MRHTAFETIGETSTPGKKVDQDFATVMFNHETLSVSLEKSLYISSRIPFGIDIDIRQLCRQMVTLVGRFHWIGGTMFIKQKSMGLNYSVMVQLQQQFS